MSLRPSQARWFETYIPRQDIVAAIEALAATGVVQLELDPRLAGPVDVDRLRYFVDRFRSLAAEHIHDLPRTGGEATALVGDPAHLANQALHHLRVWSARIEYVKAHLDQLREEVRQQVLLAECLAAMQADNLDLGGLFRETRFLCKCLFACPPGHSVDVGLNTSIEKVVHGSQHDFVYATDLPAKRDAIRRLVLDQGCEQMGIPAWLSDHPDEQQKQLQTRLGCTRNDVAQLEAEFKALRHEPEMARARANIDTLHWYLNHASGYLSGGDLCHVTGWTRATDLHTPQLALRAAKIEAIVRFPNPPPELTPPVTLLDTSWSRLFQPLLGLWGTPGRTEVDPSGLLSFIVPLMFGYMFPDVGHGLILALFAAAVWRKWPRLRFLLPCGLTSMGFGALFGEVFGLHHLIQPLWTHPLEQPVLILAVPLVFGVGLMLLGLVFAGMEAKWRGELRTWLPMDGAVLVLYASALTGLVWPQAGWLSALALLEYCLASLLLASAGERLLKFLHALGELLLSLFELTMNTLSFLRVGAFAIAHAALSYAILSLADATSSPWAWTLVVLLGNLFAIVMEGLLVFVQTTRLVLFEFFIRFLSADGRLFRPLPLATKGRQA